MNCIHKISVITALFISSGVVIADYRPTDFSALNGEYVASNPGLETVVPSWTRVDNDSNGIKDGYDFHFDVYKLGTKTKLFSTPDKYLAYAIPACTGTQYLVDSEDVRFLRIGNNIKASTDAKPQHGVRAATALTSAANPAKLRLQGQCPKPSTAGTPNRKPRPTPQNQSAAAVELSRPLERSGSGSA